MRIVLFPSAYAPAVGGVEELTRRLADILATRGHYVEVWTHRYPESLPADEVIEGTRVRRFALPLPRNTPTSLAAFPKTAFFAMRALRKAVREAHPDVLHVQCFSSNGIYATLLSAITGIPVVVSLQGETVMDDDDVYDSSVVLRRGLRAGLHRAAAVTGCSRFVLNDAERRFGLHVGRGRVVPNGVNLERESGRIPLELPFERFVFGVGRVVHKKGFDLLLEAFALLADENPHVGLLIGGDGRARPGLEDQTAALGLNDRVVLPGALSRGQVAWAMEEADVFVLPSRIEPFGIVVLEALRAGTAVVVSSRGGAPEIVTDALEGLVVDPLQTHELAAAISHLLRDESLVRDMGAAGVARVAGFSWEGVASDHEATYASVASSCRHAPVG